MPPAPTPVAALLMIELYVRKDTTDMPQKRWAKQSTGFEVEENESEWGGGGGGSEFKSFVYTSP